MSTSVIIEFDKVRYQHEVELHSIDKICYDNDFAPRDLHRYAKENNWREYRVPDVTESEDVDKLYSRTRKELTVKTAQRAISFWNRLIELEDGILDLASEELHNMWTNRDRYASISLELARLMKVVEKLRDSNKMYQEAVKVPALKDREIGELLKMAFSNIDEAKHYMTEQGIPIPDIGVEDVKRQEY